ncbi:hypothetical protein GGX14DRAFT_395206 [Mycena pura]|uniref:Uncharacterized protein n=1 Tax=Mycena pura TaxID=153505 RepID=A0AAD6YBG5_9AGAR|nr:hypothetical protein GGX14DRAFT_395206 [Mycena pura]
MVMTFVWFRIVGSLFFSLSHPETPPTNSAIPLSLYGPANLERLRSKPLTWPLKPSKLSRLQSVTHDWNTNHLQVLLSSQDLTFKTCLPLEPLCQSMPVNQIQVEIQHSGAPSHPTATLTQREDRFYSRHNGSVITYGAAVPPPPLPRPTCDLFPCRVVARTTPQTSVARASTDSLPTASTAAGTSASQTPSAARCDAQRALCLARGPAAAQQGQDHQFEAARRHRILDTEVERSWVTLLEPPMRAEANDRARARTQPDLSAGLQESWDPFTPSANIQPTGGGFTPINAPRKYSPYRQAALDASAGTTYDTLAGRRLQPETAAARTRHAIAGGLVPSKCQAVRSTGRMRGYGPFTHMQSRSHEEADSGSDFTVDGQRSHDATRDEATSTRAPRHPQARLRRWDHQDLDDNAHHGALYEHHITNEPVMQAALRRTHCYFSKASSKRSTTSGPRPTIEAQGVSARDAQCTPHSAGSTRRPPASGNEVDAEALRRRRRRAAAAAAHTSPQAPHTRRGARKVDDARHERLRDAVLTEKPGRRDPGARPSSSEGPTGSDSIGAASGWMETPTGDNKEHEDRLAKEERRRLRVKGKAFIVVSLKEGLFTHANVLFKTRFRDGTETCSVDVRQVNIGLSYFFLHYQVHINASE